VFRGTLAQECLIGARAYDGDLAETRRVRSPGFEHCLRSQVQRYADFVVLNPSLFFSSSYRRVRSSSLYEGCQRNVSDASSQSRPVVYTSTYVPTGMDSFCADPPDSTKNHRLVSYVAASTSRTTASSPFVFDSQDSVAVCADVRVMLVPLGSEL